MIDIRAEYEANGFIVYKEHEGLSTYYAKHKRDVPTPNYPLPAIVYVAEHDIEYQRCTDVLIWRVYNGVHHCPCLWECVYSYLDTI